VRELCRKVFWQHPALMGRGTGWGRVPPSPHLPAHLPGAAGSDCSQRLVISPVRHCSGPVPECPHCGLARGSIPALPTALSQPSSLLLAEDHWRLQAQERGAVRAAEPQVDQVVAEVVLPVLLRERLPRPQPGLSVRGGRQPGGPETGTQHCSSHEGEGAAAAFSSGGCFLVLLHSSACRVALLTSEMLC